MNRPSKSSVFVVNLLIALAITLVVNFSYLLLLMVDRRAEPHMGNGRTLEMPQEGVLSVVADGHGYLRYEQAAIDSVYVPMSRIRRLGLHNGDRLVAKLFAPRSTGAHYMLAEIIRRNGEKFDYRAAFNRQSEAMETFHQLFYYLILSFVLLTIITSGRRHSVLRFAVRCAWCLVAAVALYMIAPTFERHTGRIVMNFAGGNYFDLVLMLKCSFTLVVVVLYGWIYRLGSQRQLMEIENEQLKNENLITRYNMLVNQVNPHFFFNSLNSLAMLVREKQDDKALTYIDQLSYTFRYILQNGQNTSITLDEELKFAEAYAYLFKIRYADKLFFDVQIDARYRSWILPVLTLQPLIDNAVKHNIITRNKPFHISIRTEEECLVVSNLRVPKLQPEPGTGIGLENLRKRWELITGHTIEIVATQSEFTVRLPLQKPQSCCAC
ncbi:MAG: histidine kinase [Alistipes sp.]